MIIKPKSENEKNERGVTMFRLNCGVKVSFPQDEKNIKIIRETLSRIGIANKKNKVIYPSAYLIEDDEGFIIAHFKEIFPLINDNATADITDIDIERRNTIVKLLEKWGLLSIDEDIDSQDRFVFILSYKDKKRWRINHKLNLKTFDRIYQDCER